MLVMEELLTTEEVAKLLRVSEYTVRKMLRERELNGLKVRGEWRIRKSDVTDYLDKQSNQDKK